MYQSVSEMLAETDRSGRPLWEVILEDDCAERGVKRENSLKEMRRIWEAMKQADAGYDGKIRSASGLVGTDGQKYAEARSRRESLCGPLMGSVIEKMGNRKGLKWRVFKRAPLHDTFRVKPGQLPADFKVLINWPKGCWLESKITVRFWIVTIIMAALAIVTLKIR